MVTVLRLTARLADGIMGNENARSRAEPFQQTGQTRELLCSHASGRIPKPAIAR